MQDRGDTLGNIQLLVQDWRDTVGNVLLLVQDWRDTVGNVLLLVQERETMQEMYSYWCRTGETL